MPERAREREREMKLPTIMACTLLFASVLSALVSSSGAYVFYAGERDGWVTNPSESYASWAGRNRFQVNDTIVFKYRKGADSVLVVTEQDFDACNGSHPIQKLDGGDSVFRFDRSGPFFFISGVPENCRRGQKLVVVVLALRNKKKPVVLPPPPTPSPTPSVVTPPPSPSSSSGSSTGTAPPSPTSCSSSFKLWLALVVPWIIGIY